MNPFLTNIFSTPLLCGVSDNTKILKSIETLSYKFKEESKSVGLVSDAWEQAKISNQKEEYEKFGVTSFYSKNLIKEDEWQEATYFINEFSQAMINTVYGGNDLVITNMWTTIYPQEAFVPEHIHNNSFLSGVLYIKAKKNCGNLIFRDPSYIAKSMLSRSPNDFPSVHTQYTQEVSEGLMIIFPSWLPHHSQPNRSGEDRIIVSFNINIKDFAIRDTL